MADTVYVLTHGWFVVAVSTDKEQLQAKGQQVLRTEDVMEYEWRADRLGTDRETLRYRPARSGRWNTSDVSVTRMVVGEVGR